jgi:hypothetical protein
MQRSRLSSKEAASTETKLERMRAASERSRARLRGNENEIDFAHAPLSWWRERWADRGVRRLFIENFIYVRDAFNENKLVLLKFNDMQADSFARPGRKKVRFKGRRQGSSKKTQAEFFADAVVMSGRDVRAVPHEPDTEADIRAGFKTMYENLPTHLRPATRAYSDELIWFDDPLKGTVDSRITTAGVQPGHEAKGRGQTLTHLWMTETTHYRGDQQKAVTSLIEAATGGRIEVETTPFGVEWTYAVYQQGKKGEGGWTSELYEWFWSRNFRLEGARFTQGRGKTWLLLQPGELLKDVWKVLPAGANEAQKSANRKRFSDAKVKPDELKVAVKILRHLKRFHYVKRDAKWFCLEVAEYIAWRRGKIQELPGGLNQFLVEYLENDVDCFELSGRPVISGQYLREACQSSEPKENHRYIVGIDSSLGVSGGNPSGIVVLDEETGRMAFSERVLMSPDQLAFHAGGISDRFNGAFIVPERNNTGVALIGALCTLGYGEPDRLYRHLDEPAKRRIEDGKSDVDEEVEKAKLGFPTTFQGAASKSHAAMMLEESIRKEEIGVSGLFIEEARTIVWFDNETFGPIPGQSHHGDVFMATLIANYVRRTRASMTSGFVGVMPEVGYAR